MSAEFWAIIGVGASLAHLSFKQSVDIAKLRERLIRVEVLMEILLDGLHIEFRERGKP